MDDACLEGIVSRLGHSFKQRQLFLLALSHRSASQDNNERLEFLGDAILGYIIAEALYHQFPSKKEGELSRYRSQLVRKETLAEIALELGLDRGLQLGQGEIRNGGRKRQSVLADSVEAVIAAIYLDADMASCRTCVRHWYASRLEQLEQCDDIRDAKTRLQECLQAQQLPLPTYTISKTIGKSHAQTFYVNCEVAALSLSAKGIGTSRRQAEQSAALAVLQQVETNDDK